MIENNINENEMIYDIDDIIKTGNNLQEKLQGLIELADYGKGKLGIHNNKLYLSWQWFQSIQRMYYRENRIKLIDFLKNVFQDFRIYNILLNICLVDKIYLHEITKIRTKQNILTKKWKQGLLILQEQYKDDKEIIEEINKLIQKISC